MQLLLASRDCCEKALSASIGRRRTQQDSVERRAERAQTVMMGEVSEGGRVLEGAPLAPGTDSEEVAAAPISTQGTIEC